MKKTQEKAENLANNRPEPGRYHVPNLDRALMILEFLAGQSQGWGVSEIARQLDIPKNSVFRIVSTLHAHGYLLRDDGVKTYSLGRKLLALGYAAVDEHNLMEKSLDALRDLRDATGETALIGTLGHGEGVVLEQMPSPHAVKVLVEIGHRFPLHTAAPAKAMLAFLPPSETEPIIDGIRFTRFTEKTITDKEHYLAELEKIRRVVGKKDETADIKLLMGNDDIRTETFSVDVNAAYLEEMRIFLEAVAGGGSTLNDFATAADVVRLAEATLISAHTSENVPVRPVS